MTSDDGNFDPSILKRCETYSLTETNFLNDNFGVVNETTEGGDWRLSPKAAYNYFHFGDFPKVFCILIIFNRKNLRVCANSIVQFNKFIKKLTAHTLKFLRLALTRFYLNIILK